jgi:hypothetical protein
MIAISSRWILGLVLLLLLRQQDGFRTFPTRRLYSHRVGFSLSEGSESTVLSLRQQVVVEGNVTATLLKLIKLGDRWADSGVNINYLGEAFERVPGCMATVRIKTSLVPLSPVSPVSPAPTTTPTYPTTPHWVRVQGVADSRVAQGMLALLSQLCSSLTRYHTITP